jgi:hypothetical protein
MHIGLKTWNLSRITALTYFQSIHEFELIKYLLHQLFDTATNHGARERVTTEHWYQTKYSSQDELHPPSINALLM